MRRTRGKKHCAYMLSRKNWTNTTTWGKKNCRGCENNIKIDISCLVDLSDTVTQHRDHCRALVSTVMNTVALQDALGYFFS
jgi:hypothetical protein